MENLKLLLVDDNPDDRTLVIHELQKESPGLAVDQIYEAEALARALEKRSFDLVITDYKLNWSDGLQVLRRIRNWTVHHFPADGPRALNSRIPAQNASRWARSSSGSCRASSGVFTPTFVANSWISAPFA